MAIFVKKDCEICKKFVSKFKDRDIDFKAFELSTVTSYPEGKTTERVSFKTTSRVLHKEGKVEYVSPVRK